MGSTFKIREIRVPTLSGSKGTGYLGALVRVSVLGFLALVSVPASATQLVVVGGCRATPADAQIWSDGLKKALGPEFQVYGFEGPVSGDCGSAVTSPAKLSIISRAVAAVKTAPHTEPVIVAGHSAGSVIAEKIVMGLAAEGFTDLHFVNLDGFPVAYLGATKADRVCVILRNDIAESPNAPDMKSHCVGGKLLYLPEVGTPSCRDNSWCLHFATLNRAIGGNGITTSNWGTQGYRPTFVAETGWLK